MNQSPAKTESLGILFEDLSSKPVLQKMSLLFFTFALVLKFVAMGFALYSIMLRTSTQYGLYLAILALSFLKISAVLCVVEWARQKRRDGDEFTRIQI